MFQLLLSNPIQNGVWKTTEVFMYSCISVVSYSLVRDLYLLKSPQNAETSRKLETVQSKLLWQLQAKT